MYRICAYKNKTLIGYIYSFKPNGYYKLSTSVSKRFRNLADAMYAIDTVSVNGIAKGIVFSYEEV